MSDTPEPLAAILAEMRRRSDEAYNLEEERKLLEEARALLNETKGE